MQNTGVSRGLIALLTISALAVLLTTARATAEEEKVLHNCGSRSNDGILPYAGLVSDAAGNLYGTTQEGGVYHLGTVFELSHTEGGFWTEKVLHNFGNKGDGEEPKGGLIFDAAGNLYGTTSQGAHSGGVVFELSPKTGGAWTEEILHTFKGAFNSGEGAAPLSSLTFDAAGNLYGTTSAGGIGDEGTIFELTPTTSGPWTEKILQIFSNNGADGGSPQGNLIFDTLGNFYGTTVNGGASGDGVVFEMTPTGGGNWTEAILHSFSSTGGDGQFPSSGLTFDAAGNLYGTTLAGGAFNYGTVFELSSSAGGNWTETILLNFNTTDGEYPIAGLISDAHSNLYGTTGSGGANGYGAVFVLTPVIGGGWAETVLYSFGNFPDGQTPEGGLIFDTSGRRLYGTTYFGGTNDGTVFEITP